MDEDRERREDEERKKAANTEDRELSDAELENVAGGHKPGGINTDPITP